MQALLLEDDPDRGNHICAVLRKHGYHVVWAKSLNQARDAWRQRVFDLATLDHDLGPVRTHGNGRMFTRWVVEQPNVCRTRFIVHSANVIDAPSMVYDLVNAGCNVARVWPDSIEAFLRACPPAPGKGSE